jgi:hypothetical protein
MTADGIGEGERYKMALVKSKMQCPLPEGQGHFSGPEQVDYWECCTF